MPIEPYNSYLPYQKSQMEARQSPSMQSSCLEAHATPRNESGDRALCHPRSSRQHPLTPATAPSSPAVPYSENTHAHETKKEKMEERTESTKRKGENNDPQERSGE